MVNSISSSQLSSTQQLKSPPDPTKIYEDISSKVGADSNGITKDQLTSYLEQLQEEGKGSSQEAKFVSMLSENFDKLSGSNGTITSDSLKSGMDSIKPQGEPPKGAGKPPSASEVFSDLSSKVGADSTGITKDQLETYLEKLQANGQGDSEESKHISDLIEDFDSASGGTDKITADSLQTLFESKKSSMSTDIQDPSTITSDQLQPPIDIRV